MSGAKSEAIVVRVNPRSSQEKISVTEGAIHVWVHAPPADNAANTAVCALIAKKLNIRPSAVSIQRGCHSREKLLQIEGVDRVEILKRLSR